MRNQNSKLTTMENLSDIIQQAAESIGNDKLRAIMLQGVAHFAGLFADAESDISKAFDASAEAGAGEEKTPPVTISFAVKLDIHSNRQEGAIAVSIRHKHSAASVMPDPNQPELSL